MLFRSFPVTICSVAVLPSYLRQDLGSNLILAGGVKSSNPDDNPTVVNPASSTSVNLNLLPIFAYQKIYFDFYSNSQWEKHLAYSYNVDYWNGKSSVEISADMIKLRYANYPKDYFLGVLPSSQYGSVAILPSSYMSSQRSDAVIAAVSSTMDTTSVVANPAPGTSVITASSAPAYRDWETDRKSTRLNSSHRSLSRMPSSA